MSDDQVTKRLLEASQLLADAEHIAFESGDEALADKIRKWVAPIQRCAELRPDPFRVK